MEAEWFKVVRYPGAVVVHEVDDLDTVFAHASELARMTPTPYVYVRAEEARAGVSPDGRFLYLLRTEQRQTESGSVTYASGTYDFVFYRVADRREVARWKGSFYWDDSSRRSEGGVLQEWDFAADGRGFVLVRGQERERIEIPLG